MFFKFRAFAYRVHTVVRTLAALVRVCLSRERFKKKTVRVTIKNVKKKEKRAGKCYMETQGT